jgi:patatin-like phospholipase/acyl hydrolase
VKSILSIDGGGIRGIIPLACLVRLESRLGKSSHEIFDMVAGTSTGAIIAGGIALGIGARGLLALYKDMARKAFTRLPLWKVILNGGNHRYSNTFISEILNDLGADRELNGLPIDLLITAKNTGTSRTDFFVRDAPGNACLWGTMSLKDAILASIAAPTYLPAHSAEVKGVRHTWVDGGVGVAGNPSYHTAVEAIHYSSGRYPIGETRMLSFGTGRSPHSILAESANIFQWGSWVLSELLEDASDWQQYVTRTEYDMTGRIDLRRYQLDLAPDVMKNLGVSVPDDVDVTNIGLDAIWAVDLLESIGHAFADRIDFDHPDGFELKSTAST